MGTDAPASINNALLDYVTPSEKVYAAVGRLTLQWTYLEYMIEVLIWRYVGDVDKGHIFTSQMGNQSLTDVLELLVKYEEMDERGRETITHAIKGFHVLRLNRNKIVHSYNFFEMPDSGIEFSGRKKVRLFSEFDQYSLSIEQLDQQVAAVSTWGWFLHRAVDAVSDRRGADPENEPIEWRPWPEKPPLPEMLIPIRQEARPDKQSPSQSSSR